MGLGSQHSFMSHSTSPRVQVPPSARSTYPLFLSVQETTFLQLRWAWRGLCDSFRWDVVFSTVARYVSHLCKLQTVAFMILATPKYVPMSASLSCSTHCRYSRSTSLTSCSIHSSGTTQNGSTGTSDGSTSSYGCCPSSGPLSISTCV